VAEPAETKRSSPDQPKNNQTNMFILRALLYGLIGGALLFLFVVFQLNTSTGSINQSKLKQAALACVIISESISLIAFGFKAWVDSRPKYKE
jgi:hypothetical protein